MSWKEKWEVFKENLLHHEKAQEHMQQEERKAKERDEALHHADKSSGSETLDD
jgi:hypothetical protein